MDEFHIRLDGSIVAESRCIVEYAGALCSETRPRILLSSMPIGTHTPVAFASNRKANHVVILPQPGPYYAFEWVILEVYNSRRTDIDSRLVAHSRLYVLMYF